MKLAGNTIFITGGGSGIGLGLAQALHARGNEIIIAGRRKSVLDAATKANSGIHAVEMDVADPASIKAAAARVIAQFPALNVVINNAGIMQYDNAAGVVDEEVLVSTVTTNLLGPIRVTSAFIDHLKAQEAATVIHVSSVLAFVPMAVNAVYSSTKAALHSYALSQRYKLRGTSVEVLEIAPPRVATDLLNGVNDARAMPLAAYIEQTMAALEGATDEVLIEVTHPLRNNPGPNEHSFVTHFNDVRANDPGHH